MHMHTPLCQHADGQVHDYAQAACQRGLKGVIVTCHNPLPDGLAATSRMRLDQFDEYLDLVDRARADCADFADVRVGLECDYMPQLEPFLADQINSAPLHYVLGSVHPQLPEYREAFFDGDDLVFQKTYFTHLAQAAESGLVDALSHPDLVKNMYADTWQLERVFDHVCACLDRIAAAGVAMELNTSGANKAIAEINPSPRILEQMQARGIAVVIGADAHTPERVGEGFGQALAALADVGYRQVSYFLERRRVDVDIDTARQSLRGVTAGQTCP